MEWARAKTILIITFFLLNVILGYQLWITKVADSYFEQAGIREEVQQLLRSKNIRLEKEIPRETPQLREITVTLSGDKNAIEPVRLERPFKLQQLARKRIAKDIEKQIPFIDEYEYDPIQSREGLYVMNQLYEQWPMLKSISICFTKKMKCINLRRRMRRLSRASTKRKSKSCRRIGRSHFSLKMCSLPVRSLKKCGSVITGKFSIRTFRCSPPNGGSLLPMGKCITCMRSAVNWNRPV